MVLLLKGYQLRMKSEGNSKITLGGSNSKFIKDNCHDYQTDVVNASSLGLGKFSKDATYWGKIIISVSSAGLCISPQPNDSCTMGTGTQALFYLPADTTLSDVMTAGQFTSTGTAPTNPTLIFMPIVLGVPVDLTDHSYISLGDSIGFGVGSVDVSAALRKRIYPRGYGV